MIFESIIANDVGIVLIKNTESEPIIKDIQSALDLMATIRYETGYDRIVINKLDIVEEFFDLSTRIAGDILQKFVNYSTKLAVVGDFSRYESGALNDFIFECNKGNSHFFVATYEEAVAKLSKAV